MWDVSDHYIGLWIHSLDISPRIYNKGSFWVLVLVLEIPL